MEPLCNIGRLTKYLNKKGWTLGIVPELDDLTIGGMSNGRREEAGGGRLMGGLDSWPFCLSFDDLTIGT